MKFLTAAALTALVMAASGGNALATTYQFSYDFLDGGTPGGAAGTAAGTVTGTFDGNGPITSITGITNISMSLNGTPMAGSFYAWSYNAPSNVGGFPGNFTLGTAVVSSDPAQNNFLFTNAATGAQDPGNYFYIIQPWNNNGPGSTTIATQLRNEGVAIDAYNGQYVTSNWSISAAPEPAAWALMMVGVGGMGAALRTRRRKAVAA